MQKIVPFLWFDNQAEEAVNFYISLFGNSKILNTTHYNEQSANASGRDAGTVMTLSFQLDGQEFSAINGGQHFKINPSISLFVLCETEAEVDRLWEKLSKDGMVMMDLQKFEWSEKYGWVQDKFGLSWQIFLGNKNDVPQTITPCLLFVGKQHGRAEEAIHYYTSVFKDSNISGMLRYEAGEVEPEGTIKHAQFSLCDHLFMAMESSMNHAFAFNEAISFVINCKSQEEIDYYWEQLSKGGDPKAQQCGWLKDKFDISWQIIPEQLGEFLNSSNSAKVMEAILKMDKLNLEIIKQASI